MALPTEQMDIVVGASAALVGGTGTIVSIATATLSLLTLGINLVIGIGGIYLLYYRIKKMKEMKKDE